MVYESDFYTTRRPYTRPISSHYTVTVRDLPHHLPYIAHKKLVNVIHTPYPLVYYTHTAPVPIRIYSRVRPSVIAAELQRIRDLPRPSSVSYVSRYLNSKDNILFDDEAREIRARADSLLRRIHVFVPRPSSSDFAEVIVPERMRSDDYVRRVLTARKNAKKDEEHTNYYESPDSRHFGTGNLASVSYTGGKPHSRRRPYYKLNDLRAADVQSDVNLLSFYAKNRQAAASALLQRKLDEEELRRQVEELKRQAEEEKRRLAEEARLAEERYKAEIEERVRLEEEARQARLKEIEEQERLEAERQAEEIRIETERLRDLKIAEEQQRADEYEAALALEEEERYVIEKASEDARKRQEREEKLASEVVLGEQEEDNAPESTFDECHCHDNVKSQDHEARPDSPDADDDTQVEEEAACISTDHDELSDHPYDGEHEGFNSIQELDTPIENIPQVDEIDSDENTEIA